jgi:hypothetical protein
MALDRLSAEIAELDMLLPARPETRSQPTPASPTSPRPPAAPEEADDDPDDSDPERTTRMRIPIRVP